MPIILLLLIALIVVGAARLLARAPHSPPPLPREGRGLASYYGKAYVGRTMANGKPYDPERYTFACWGLPLGTRVEFYYHGRVVAAVCTDRGPAYYTHRQFDFSRSLFVALAGDESLGVLPVYYRVIPEYTLPRPNPFLTPASQ